MRKNTINHIIEMKLCCNTCDKIVVEIDNIKRDYYIQSGKIYCSKECGKKSSSESRKITMTNTNKKYASLRMKKKNPMYNENVINLMINTKKENGTLNLRPKILGGNGREIPVPVKILQEKLNWEVRYVFNTNEKSPYPTNYKLQLANLEHKIVVECDGQSSCSRKDEIQRKKELLEKCGWTMLRFPNREVLKDSNKVYLEIMKCVTNKEKEAMMPQQQ